MRSKLWLTMLLMALASAGYGASQDNSPPNPEAAQARQEIQGIERLLPQLPDRGPALFELAHDYALVGNLDQALALLKECVGLHEGFTPEGDPVLERLKSNREYDALVGQTRREFLPVRRARLAFTVSDDNLIPEGLAADSSRHLFYMSSLSRKKIVRISVNGELSDFIHAGQYDLQSVCGIKVEASNGHLWANTCPNSGKGAELVHFDLQGKVLERFGPTTPGPHLFNDLVLRGADEVYLTDSLDNKAFRFDRKTHAFTALAFPRSLYYPNGIALSDDGNQLYVADAFGVLQYDLRNDKGHELQAGASNTISGFDGLYWYRGKLLGIQNSLGLPRVAQFQLSDDGTRVTAETVLEYRSEFVEFPTTGAIDGSNFYFMANTHLDNWKDDKIVDPKRSEAVRIAVLHLD
jgi:sugar lactone lactonase YvrE